MSLVVHTARVSYGGPDRLDVTRASGGAEGTPFAPSPKLLAAGKRMAFEEYRRLYIAEMRASYHANRRAWDALLARERVVLCCYCTDPERCHRSALAWILGKLGARIDGEIGLYDAVARVHDAADRGDKITPRLIMEATLARTPQRFTAGTTIDVESREGKGAWVFWRRYVVTARGRARSVAANPARAEPASAEQEALDLARLLYAENYSTPFAAADPVVRDIYVRRATGELARRRDAVARAVSEATRPAPRSS